MVNRLLKSPVFLVALLMMAIGVSVALYRGEFPLLSVQVDPESYLPKDSNDWSCGESRITEQEMQSWCENNPYRGVPLDESIFKGSLKPASLMNLDEKNAYDKRLTEFVINKKYIDLNWMHDQSWRMTGPYVGKPGEGASFGVHPAVKIYYSPEIINWLCDGRKAGEIPDGAMIVKAMRTIDSSLQIITDSHSCMTIAADSATLDASPSEFTIMVKDKNGSRDGWYWSDAFKGSQSTGNPPIVGKSAFQSEGAAEQAAKERLINLHPTGNLSTNKNDEFIPSMVYPYNGFGVACLNCHGSAMLESTFASLENIMGEGIKYKGFNLDQPVEAKKANAVAFPTPYFQPQESFLKYFDSISTLSYVDAWQLRLPAQTYNHTVPLEEDAEQFLTSDQCMACHDATASNDSKPNMIYTDKDNNWINLSMYGEWSVSPMGLAGRDPIFFSQLQSETNYFPSVKDCIENTCLHCHGVLGQRQFSRNTADSNSAKACSEALYPFDPSLRPPDGVPMGELFTVGMVDKWQSDSGHLGGLARDGISCMACHQMIKNPEQSLPAGASYHGSDSLSLNQPYYTGNFLTTSNAEVFGPIINEEIVTAPMDHVVGLTPKYAKHISQSEMCGNCHNILLPVMTNQGEVVGASYEQTTHLEWVNSSFADPKSGMFQSCQDCHMPHSFEGEALAFKIANIESNNFAPTTNRLPDDEITLNNVSPYARHSLHGVNVFLNQMFQQFPEILGYRQIDYMNSATEPSILTGQNSMLSMAKNETASVSIDTLTRLSNRIKVNVSVKNKTGHFLPSGVGFRRMFLELLALDGKGEALWASGRTNSVGLIVDGITQSVLPSELPLQNPKIWQPHYQTISDTNQVQIYQEVILDSSGNTSTSFLRRMQHVKDNRIRPIGFDPQFFEKQSSKYIQALSELHGETKDDPFYVDPKKTGVDTLEYVISLPPSDLEKVESIKVTLYSQSIPPGYLQQRFGDASYGKKPKRDAIDRLFYLASHLNVTDPKDSNGERFLKDWKLKIGNSAIKMVSKKR